MTRKARGAKANRGAEAAEGIRTLSEAEARAKADIFRIAAEASERPRRE